MGVAAIDLSHLPSVSAGHAAATRLAARLLGGAGRRAVLDIAPLGRVTLAYAGISRPADVAPAVAFEVRRNGQRGRLCLDARLARGFAAAFIDRKELPVLRRMGSAERGLLAGLIAVALDKLGSDLEISLGSEGSKGSLGAKGPQSSRGPRGPWGTIDGALPFAIDVAAPGFAGQVVLEVPPQLLADRAAGSGWTSCAAALSVSAALELAATYVPAGALMDLEPGDAVVFDGIPALQAGGPARWAARLTVGDHAAEVMFAAGGSPELTVLEAFRPHGRSGGRGPERAHKEIDMNPSRTSSEGMRALAAAPIEVIAEVGRVVLRGDEVLGLTPGAVIALPGVRNAVVSLRVGAEIWAEGELVNVDGELGVRVIAVRRPEPSFGADQEDLTPRP